jgi:hypothetical protein
MTRSGGASHYLTTATRCNKDSRLPASSPPAAILSTSGVASENDLHCVGGPGRPGPRRGPPAWPRGYSLRHRGLAYAPSGRLSRPAARASRSGHLGPTESAVPASLFDFAGRSRQERGCEASTATAKSDRSSTRGRTGRPDARRRNAYRYVASRCQPVSAAHRAHAESSSGESRVRG